VDLLLAGTRTVVAGTGPVADAVRDALAAEGAAIQADTAGCAVAVVVLPPQPEGPLTELESADALVEGWQSVEAVVTLFRDALPSMTAARDGRLILVGPIEIKTMTGRQAPLDRIAGLGLLGMMKALSGEVGPDAITCNSVLIDLAPPDPAERAALIASAAAAVSYLASPHANFLTGLVVGVDRARSGSIF
jgi:NAD(P)-dependent dehydrogenase (short-subunit alcohol dehydrogenase family)